MRKTCFFIFVVWLFSACRYDHVQEITTNDSGYPPAVDNIMRQSCAVSGCHNALSKDAAAGLDLSTWESMFKGTNNGAVTIPFRADFSTLCFFTNTDSTLGLVSLPTMPINGTPLTKEQYLTLRDWINQGAPDKDGKLRFSDNPSRSKFYVVNQGCDVGYVFDAKERVAMRVIDLGQQPGASPPEAPHNVKVTPDGRFWVVVFLNADIVQVFSTETDRLVKTIPIGDGVAGGWNTLMISKDSRKAYVVDYNGGRVAFVDLEAGTSITKGPFPITGSQQPSLHGVALNKNDDTLYVTCEQISRILKIPVNDVINYEDVNINPPGPDFLPFAMRPHELVFSPDYSMYFISCQDTSVNQVRVFSTATNQLLKAIPVGRTPLELAVSASRNLVFVTNTEDNFFPGIRGSISVIDIATLTELKKIRVGWQPHGLAVNEQDGVLYVANRNISGGVAPHHASACAGRNGYLSIINLDGLEADPDFRPEVSVDPYAIGFKP